MCNIVVVHVEDNTDASVEGGGRGGGGGGGGVYTIPWP